MIFSENRYPLFGITLSGARVAEAPQHGAGAQLERAGALDGVIRCGGAWQAWDGASATQALGALLSHRRKTRF